LWDDINYIVLSLKFGWYLPLFSANLMIYHNIVIFSAHDIPSSYFQYRPALTNSASTLFIVITEPVLEHLFTLVVPRIATHWRTIAPNLQLDSSSINAIAQRENNIAFKCCREMLTEWHGRPHESTWEMLLDAVRQDDNLQDVCNEIEREVIQLDQ